MAAPRPTHPPLCETNSTLLSHPNQQPQAAAYDHTREAFSISTSPPSLAPSASAASLPQPPSFLGETTDKTSWNYVLRSGFAGGIAGCVAKSAIAPLDRVKILFQAQNPEFQKYSGKWLGVFQAGRDIVRSDGPCALFQGHSATLMRIFPYAAIKYMAYDKLHFYLMPTKEMETSARLFLAGSASGVLSVFLTYPLELIRVRLAFETKRKRQKGGLRRIIGMIYREGATEAPFSSDARKRAARMAQQAYLSTSATAAVSGSSSTSTFESALRATDPHVPSSAVPAGNKLLSKHPILKFYRGFSVTVMGMIPYAGTSFLVFGRCKTLLQDLFPPSEPSADTWGSRRQWYWPSKTVVDLSAGAIAGALSQTAAYPFEVIRRRQQVGGIIRPGAMLGMWETAGWIYKTSGCRGFYVGLSIGFLKVVPMTSISFAVWLGMKRQMGI
ncbi:probable LEU5 - mitochondrial coenzyme A transporter- member of the mitochondrial carrier (MCF) family [Ustilago sp. UG-2017b]|nr:probable LEU5 - mitochondrial coenzyme A transporter- member of the mitochondrial carrier (MCF) family [Ustilago sp. UG-2017b]